VCADVLAPPVRLLAAADIAVSFGVVEHFRPTEGVLAAIARLVRPNGLVMTLVPNLSGSIGLLTHLINPDVYAKHVPLSSASLRRAHECAGLTVRECRYFMSTSFGVANLQGVQPTGIAYRAKAASLRALKGVSKIALAVEDRTHPLPATRLLSPYVVCLAQTTP
jgi:2-polyprenyl-3-methyl-5-hydroxy-6-metoxy-1,4-benzoquinol methylase